MSFLQLRSPRIKNNLAYYTERQDSLIKKVIGVLRADIKKIAGVALASVKKVAGLA